jgi:putative sigma-54 modulation protein
MKIKYTWKHLDHSNAAEEYADKKLERMEKYVQKIISCDVVFEMIHGEVNANVKLHADHSDFNAHHKDKDIYACIDRLEDKLERQLSKYHSKKAAHS